jgi:AcrR family transcriptional regulator
VVDVQIEQARAPRVDAQRNRVRLMEAATAAFSERGEATVLEDVARRAGVGIGTLYRHFPTRDALVEAVYRHEVETLCAAADEFLATLPPDEALAAWMQRFVSHVAAKRGMSSALKAMVGTDATLFDDTRNQMYAAAKRLLDAGAAAEVIRDDIDPVDLVRAMSGMCLATATDQANWTAQARPIVGLLLDGLRYGATGRGETAEQNHGPGRAGPTPTRGG